ncbi:response regulator [Corallococcus exercitus]|uniref:response regulator n=1 Tax=Corallococcus exercitus TaxID=2316736 RepID=UPI000EA0C3C2|nr:response regulator [Corallococcus exercitus]RKG80446.1 response regulator [Corallococcus exercitus]
MPSHTLLLVDDDAAIADALSELLVDEGYTVVTAANGAEALRYLRANVAPSLILLDLMMPVMDGYAFREVQREDPALSHIPVFILSAGHLGDRVRSLGVAGVFKKPLLLDALLAAIQEHCAPRA